MDDFVLGLIESSKELLNPFITESIWTEALQDVAPILGRDGTDSQGRRIWNVEDSGGNKLMKALGHLVEAQAPLNYKQLQRLGLSMFPVDSKGRFNKSGDEYEFGNEALGILGMRRVDVNPQKSFNFKVSTVKPLFVVYSVTVLTLSSLAIIQLLLPKLLCCHSKYIVYHHLAYQLVLSKTKYLHLISTCYKVVVL